MVGDVCMGLKETFISIKVTSVRIQLQLLAPQFHMAAAQPVPKRRFALQG
jgi:hypothetical protein